MTTTTNRSENMTNKDITTAVITNTNTQIAEAVRVVFEATDLLLDTTGMSIEEIIALADDVAPGGVITDE